MTDRYEKIRKALAMGPTPGPWGYTELPRDVFYVRDEQLYEALRKAAEGK